MSLNKKFFTIVAMMAFLLIPASIYAQSSFDDLVSELLGTSDTSNDGNSNLFDESLTNDDVDDSCGYDDPNDTEDDIEILKFEDDELVIELPAAKDGGNVYERYEVTVMPVEQNDVDELLDDDDLVDILDIIEAKRIAPQMIGEDKIQFALKVTDSDDTQYLSIYPLDGNTRCQGIEDYRIDEGDGPNNPSNNAENLADCLDSDCEDIIDQVSCSVNEETLRATITWNHLGGADDLEIFMREHDEDQFELESTESLNDETFSLTLPKRTSYLFLLRPVDNDGRKEWTEVTYLCKFTDGDSSQPAACVGEDCIGVTPPTGPESAILIILGLTVAVFLVRKVIKK